MGQQTVHPGNPNVVKPHHFISQHPRRKGGLLRHRDIACSPGCHHNLPNPVRHGKNAHDAYAGLLIICHLMFSAYRFRFFRGKPGDQNHILPVPFHSIRNTADLLRRFACTVDYFRRSLAHLPVKVHLGIPDIRKGFRLYLKQCLIYRHPSILDRLKDFPHLMIHPLSSKSSKTAP